MYKATHTGNMMRLCRFCFTPGAARGRRPCSLLGREVRSGQADRPSQWMLHAGSSSCSLHSQACFCFYESLVKVCDWCWQPRDLSFMRSIVHKLRRLRVQNSQYLDIHEGPTMNFICMSMYKPRPVPRVMAKKLALHCSCNSGGNKGARQA